MKTDPPIASLAPGHLFCFGLGYTAKRLSIRLLAEGWTVSGTVQTEEKRSAMAALGITGHLFGPEHSLADPTTSLGEVTHLLSSIPPTEAGDPALIEHQAALRAAPLLRWVGYLSTPAVYGDRQGALVQETDTPNPGSVRGHRRLEAESNWVKTFSHLYPGGSAGGSIQIFRLSGIYGPARNAIAQVRAGTARIIDKPGQVFNRIHVDDIVTILMASMVRPNHGQIYNVADTEACASGDVVRHACALLGVSPPQPIAFDSAVLSAMARSFYSECKRLDTHRLTNELGVELAYPTYREGLASIMSSDFAR
jgi:nucleoside-diphosphate-sugar epimerase